MKIYVCESGCPYDGGSAFAATTSLLKAWRIIRDRRIAAEQEERDMPWREPDFIKYDGNYFWSGRYEYFRIRVFEDAA